MLSRTFCYCGQKEDDNPHTQVDKTHLQSLGLSEFLSTKILNSRGNNEFPQTKQIPTLNDSHVFPVQK